MEKPFDYGFRKTCKVLGKMVQQGWKAHLRHKSELRLHSPQRVSLSPEEALYMFTGKGRLKPITGSWRRLFERVECEIAPALHQHPYTALSIAVSAGGRTLPVFHGLKSIRTSPSRRRALFEACGLDPQRAL